MCKYIHLCAQISCKYFTWGRTTHIKYYQIHIFKSLKSIVCYNVESSTTTQACEEEGRQDETTVTNQDHLPETREIGVQCSSCITPKTVGTQTDVHTREIGTQCCMGLWLIDASYIKPKTIGTQTRTSKKNAVGTQVDFSLPTTTSLASLLKHCSCCGSVVTKSEESTRGSMLSIQLFCINGHESVWSWQPLFNNVPAGNLYICIHII